MSFLSLISVKREAKTVLKREWTLLIRADQIKEMVLMGKERKRKEEGIRKKRKRE